MTTFTALVLTFILGVAPPTGPCDANSAYRDFDFWIGSWEVRTADGALAGRNVVTAEEGGCVLVERWKGSGGSTGMSINFLDPRSGTWRQQWVSAVGYLVELEGRPSGGSMVLTGELIKPDGASTPMRGTWTPLDDGRVRQLFETRDADGEWSTWFDGYYERIDQD